MRQSNEFFNLPVMSMTEGTSVGITKSFVIDANTRKAVALIVKTTDWYTGVKFIPVEQIAGVGKDALMIERVSNIIPYRNIQSSEELLKEDIIIVGATVISSDGIKKGKITEYVLDDTYNIVKLLAVDEAHTDFEILINDVSVISKEFVILNKIKEDIEDIPKPNKFENKVDGKKIEEMISNVFDCYDKPLISQDCQFGDKKFFKGTPVTKALLKDIAQKNPLELEDLIANYIE